MKFVIFVGFFNTVGSLLFQMLSPYGVSPATSGYLGAVLIDCGRVTATIVSPIIDKFQPQLISMTTTLGL
jgi:FLVCR family MFS transporter 7